MKELPHLFENNRRWAAAMRARDAGFFERLALQQTPKYLWIGCADSRVPANEIVGLPPGELFVHRNIANVVVHTDLNCLSVIHFAVEVLRVQHVIVCGHYGCSGVRAALAGTRLGMSDNWIRHVQDVRRKHSEALAALSDDMARNALLCELNVLEQVMNVCQTSIAQEAWERGQPLQMHGWIYGLDDGHLRDLGFHAKTDDEAHESYTAAVAALVQPVPQEITG